MAAVGRDLGIFLAEYNAVMTEHLLDRLYRAHVERQYVPSEVVPELLAHGQWFVTEHFKPFPTTPSDALARWTGGIDAGRLAALSPYFFDMKSAERSDPSFASRTWTARFAAGDRPAGWAQLTPLVVQTIQTIAR